MDERPVACSIRTAACQRPLLTLLTSVRLRSVRAYDKPSECCRVTVTSGSRLCGSEGQMLGKKKLLQLFFRRSFVTVLSTLTQILTSEWTKSVSKKSLICNQWSFNRYRSSLESFCRFRSNILAYICHQGKIKEMLLTVWFTSYVKHLWIEKSE